MHLTRQDRAFLLEVEGSTGLATLFEDVPGPARIHPPRTRTACAADDGPAQSIRSQPAAEIQRPHERLSRKPVADGWHLEQLRDPLIGPDLSRRRHTEPDGGPRILDPFRRQHGLVVLLPFREQEPDQILSLIAQRPEPGPALVE